MSTSYDNFTMLQDHCHLLLESIAYSMYVQYDT